MQQQPGMKRVRLLVLGFIGFMVIMVVWGVYLALSKPAATPSEQQTATPNTSSELSDEAQQLAQEEADETKITTLARQWCETTIGGAWVDWLVPQSLELSDDRQFANGLAGCPPKDAPWAAADKSYFLYYKKINNTWSLIYKGSNPPCENITAEYGVPGDWVVSIPSADGSPRSCGS